MLAGMAAPVVSVNVIGGRVNYALNRGITSISSYDDAAASYIFGQACPFSDLVKQLTISIPSALPTPSARSQTTNHARDATRIVSLLI